MFYVLCLPLYNVYIHIIVQTLILVDNILCFFVLIVLKTKIMYKKYIQVKHKIGSFCLIVLNLMHFLVHHWTMRNR